MKKDEGGCKDYKMPYKQDIIHYFFYFVPF
jgi:hypothetical protein